MLCAAHPSLPAAQHMHYAQSIFGGGGICGGVGASAMPAHMQHPHLAAAAAAARPRAAAAKPAVRPRGCLHCVSCWAARGPLPSLASSTAGEEGCDLWPGGLPSPTIYYALRAKQLEHQYRYPQRDVRQWRATGESQSEPSAMLAAGGRRPLLLAVPTAYTNIAQNDTRIQYVSTHSAALRPRPAAAPAAAAADLAPAPAPAAPAALQRTLSGVRRGACPEAEAALGDPKRHRAAAAAQQQSPPRTLLPPGLCFAGQERGHIVMMGPGSSAGSSGAASPLLFSAAPSGPSPASSRRLALMLGTPPAAASRAPLSAAPSFSAAAPMSLGASPVSALLGGSGGPSPLATAGSYFSSLGSAGGMMAATPELAAVSASPPPPAAAALLPLHRHELQQAQYQQYQAQHTQQQYQQQHHHQHPASAEAVAAQYQQYQLRYLERQYRIKSEQAYHTTACVVELPQHAQHAQQHAAPAEAQQQPLSVTHAWALLRSLAGTLGRRMSPSSAAQ